MCIVDYRYCIVSAFYSIGGTLILCVCSAKQYNDAGWIIESELIKFKIYVVVDYI